MSGDHPFGDNLKILREYVPDASVDLIYLDPPFNSSATYNVLFKKDVAQGPLSGPAAFQVFHAAQITAFDPAGRDGSRAWSHVAHNCNASLQLFNLERRRTAELENNSALESVSLIADMAQCTMCASPADLFAC
jgi:hypothetical protein